MIIGFSVMVLWVSCGSAGFFWAGLGLAPGSGLLHTSLFWNQHPPRASSSQDNDRAQEAKPNHAGTFTVSTHFSLLTFHWPQVINIISGVGEIYACGRHWWITWQRACISITENEWRSGTKTQSISVVWHHHTLCVKSACFKTLRFGANVLQKHNFYTSFLPAVSKQKTSHSWFFFFQAPPKRCCTLGPAEEAGFTAAPLRQVLPCSVFLTVASFMSPKPN